MIDRSVHLADLAALGLLTDIKNSGLYSILYLSCTSTLIQINMLSCLIFLHCLIVFYPCFMLFCNDEEDFTYHILRDVSPFLNALDLVLHLWFTVPISVCLLSPTLFQILFLLCFFVISFITCLELNGAWNCHAHSHCSSPLVHSGQQMTLSLEPKTVMLSSIFPTHTQNSRMCIFSFTSSWIHSQSSVSDKMGADFFGSLNSY